MWSHVNEIANKIVKNKHRKFKTLENNKKGPGIWWTGTFKKSGVTSRDAFRENEIYTRTGPGE